MLITDLSSHNITINMHEKLHQGLMRSSQNILICTVSASQSKEVINCVHLWILVLWIWISSCGAGTKGMHQFWMAGWLPETYPPGSKWGKLWSGAKFNRGNVFYTRITTPGLRGWIWLTKYTLSPYMTNSQTLLSCWVTSVLMLL